MSSSWHNAFPSLIVFLCTEESDRGALALPFHNARSILYLVRPLFHCFQYTARILRRIHSPVLDCSGLSISPTYFFFLNVLITHYFNMFKNSVRSRSVSSFSRSAYITIFHLCNLLFFPHHYCLYLHIYNNLFLCYNFIKVIPITYYQLTTGCRTKRVLRQRKEWENHVQRTRILSETLHRNLKALP